MSTPAATCLPRPIPLQRPLVQRAWESLLESAQALRASLHRPPRARVVEWSIDDIAALNDATLRDIGVPEALRAEAALRRGADHRSMLEMHAAANGLFIRQL